MAFSKKKWVLLPLSILLFLGIAYWIIGKIQYRNNVMDVEEYAPISTLKVQEHLLTKAKFPFIDVHNHQFTMPVQNLDDLVKEMDELNMAVMVNLSGFRGKYLEWSLDNVNEKYSDRFTLFMNIDFEKVDDEVWPNETLSLMEESFKLGVRGLKVYKSLGLTDKDSNGNRSR